MPDCNTCKAKNSPPNVPYVVHEGVMSRLERVIKRLWITVIVAVCLLFVSNAGWLIYESQFETLEYSYDYQQDGQGTNIIWDGNDVNNGATAESEG